MVRYGVEVEGRFKGLKSLVLLRAEDHHRVDQIIAEHNIEVEHVWLEVEHHPYARFSWPLIEVLATRFKITVLVRDLLDLPVAEYDHEQICLVLRANEYMKHLLLNVEYVQVATGLGTGYEFSRRPLSVADYEGDEVWPS